MEIRIMVDEAFTRALEHLASAISGTNDRQQPKAEPEAAKTPEPPKYTLEQLVKAGAGLVSKNPNATPALCALLRDKYGVNALTKVNPDRFNEMADDLRGFGAEVV